MSATAASLSVSLKDTSITIQVPDDDVARLMYYLHCVTTGLHLNILDADLVTWQNYASLPAIRVATMFQAAVELHPDDLVGQTIFRDDAHEVISKDKSNAFISITSASQYASVQRNVVLSGQTRSVSNVMFFKSPWLEKNYYQPVKNIGYALRGIKHCDHCRGSSGTCACRYSCTQRPGAGCNAPAPWWAYVVVVLGGILILYIFYRGLRSLFV